MRVTGSNRLAVPERHWVEYPAKRLACRVSLLVIAVLIFVGGGIASLAAHATPAAVPVQKEDPEGGLFLRRPDGTMLDTPAPAVDAAVRIDITGVIARVKVAQTFKNPDAGWVEGIYVFPLSRSGAVDHMIMRIGDRIVEGRIQERETAKRQYESAKRSGRKAGLVEQERPNIFTASVANIPPGESIVVEISYQQPVDIEDGLYSIRFPMVVNPRYIPESPQIAGVGGTGWAVNTVTVPDAERITPSMRHPAIGKANPVRIAVQLSAGMPVTDLRSLYHPVTVSEAGANAFAIALDGGPVPADRDFVVEWRPAPGVAPKAALFQEQHEGETYILAMVVPPRRDDAGQVQRLPREGIFIIDTSGSMHGESILQARQALRLAVDRLDPQDGFNIVGFASHPTALFPSSRRADPQALAEARGFIDGLKAEGGTEMGKALDLALDGRSDTGRLRQIVLLTDGSVGNEAELFRNIRRGIGDSRLFTVGIGSAPNGHFMDRAARFGRGTFTFIGKTSEVAEKMGALFAKLGEPVLTDVAIALPGDAVADIQPDRIPDLYLGEPIVVTARLPKADGDLKLNGRFDGRDWSESLVLASAAPGQGIGKLWAKRKIEALSDKRHEGMSEDAVREAVLKVALPHQIMSRYTSLVAIDQPVSRPAGESMSTRPVPTNPPAGWTPPGQAAPGHPLQRAQGTAVQQFAQAGVPGATVQLHAQTATPAEQHFLIGLLSIGLALILLSLLRRKAA
jgi:Ca-activated chloride channel family protein